MTPIGFSLELESGALTALSGLPAVTVCRHGEAVLFSDGTQLFQVGGDTDDGTPIAARLTLPATDCGEPGPKRLHGLIVEGRLDSEAEITATSPEGGALHGTAPAVGAVGQSGRSVARLGRGYGSHWQVGLETTATGTFDIGAITLVVLPLDRRLS